MICGLGIDAASIERCLRLDKHAIRRIFNPAEVAQYEKLAGASEMIRAQFLASRFAVKEAYAKARGLGFCGTVVPAEIRTETDSEGRPYVVLEGGTLASHPSGVRIHVSITHQQPLAICVVILEKESESVGTPAGAAEDVTEAGTGSRNVQS